MTYDVQDRIRISAVFRNLQGDLADPTTVSISVMKPSRGPATVYTAAGGEVVRDSLGTFHFDLTLDEPGTWTYKWTGTGNAQAAQESELFVQRGAFA